MFNPPFEFNRAVKTALNFTNVILNKVKIYILKEAITKSVNFLKCYNSERYNLSTLFSLKHKQNRR